MNKAIKELDYSRLLFLDLEMATQEKELPNNGDLYKTFSYKQRDRETDEIPDYPTLQDLYLKKGSLSPVYGQIICGTIGQVRDNKIVLKTLKGEEHEVISDILNIISKSGYILVTFNGLEFDLPYIRKRACVHNIEFPEHLNDVGKKSWDMDKIHLDIMKLHKGAGWSIESLDELCFMYGVKSPKTLSENPNLVYWKEGIEPIAEYNQGDVKALINLFRVMRGENIIE